MKMKVVKTCGFVAKAMLRRKLIALNAYTRKEEES